MIKYPVIPLAALVLTPSLLNAQPTVEDSPVYLEEVTVFGVRQRLYEAGTLLDAIQKTEVVDADLIKSMQSVNLTDAIAHSPGVRVSNECSMCGVKRVMLNGMRGEHSTILTDGIPLHTMLAGYYALDALATTGVSRIEVARGAGASLLAPEAVGGTINVMSKEPEENGMQVNISREDNDSYLLGVQGQLVSRDERVRASLAIQDDAHKQVDNDANGVSEAPLQENTNYIGYLSWDVSDKDNVIFRLGYTESEIFGGPQGSSIEQTLESFRNDPTESSQFFVNGDVRERWIGKDWETAEWIETERNEFSLSWLHEFNGSYNLSLTAARSEHKQNSFYEGFDYQANDELLYVDVRNNWVVNDQHLLTFGLDQRDEAMRSDSAAGAASSNYVEDSFDYHVLGFYFQDTVTLNDQIELSLAVRVDDVNADFVAPEKQGTEIDKTVVAPRADIRVTHNGQWTSRLSMGRGYRAPLSFFETDHGILDAGDGFAIDVDDLEQSLSATYALSFEGERLNTTVSTAWTRVENLASIDETPAGVPVLTQIEDDATVIASDISLGYLVGDALRLGATFETYHYDERFKESFAIAPVEERATFSADWNYGAWQWYSSATWVGGRNLSDYGYEGFNIFTSDPKRTDAEAFWTIDAKLSYAVNEALSLYAGGKNLTGYTQVEDAETPLFRDVSGAYDVAYIYAPLRGRAIYMGFEYEI